MQKQMDAHGEKQKKKGNKRFNLIGRISMNAHLFLHLLLMRKKLNITIYCYYFSRFCFDFCFGYFYYFVCFDFLTYKAPPFLTILL